METFTKGDIVLFPFPYTDLTNRKLRPCLVLSNEMKGDILLCQITSNRISKDEFSISLKSTETLEGSLELDGFVRTNMLFTANKEQILKKVCSIKKEKYYVIVKKIISLIEW